MSDNQSTLLKFMYTLGLFGGGSDALSDYAENGETPQVVLDFVNETYAKAGTVQSAYSDVATFARASTGYYFNSSGVLTSASSGTPRIGSYLYSGAAWVDKGLMLESEARTNLATNSTDFTGGAWTIANTDSVTVTANQANGPNGSNTMDRLAITDTTNERHYIYDLITLTSNVDYCLSVTAKADEQAFLCLCLQQTATANNWASAVFNLSTGAVTKTGGGAGTGTVSGTHIVDLGGGIYRCTLVGQGNWGNSVQCKIAFVSSATPTFNTTGEEDYAGTAGDGLFVDDFQVELGSVPSSVIKTSGATATRAAETLTIAAANMSYSSTAMSFHQQMTVSYVDNDVANQFQTWKWSAAANGQTELNVFTNLGRTGLPVFESYNISGGGSNIQQADASQQISPGIEVAFNWAARMTTTDTNLALAGTAQTANTAQSGIYDFSANQAVLCNGTAAGPMGHISLFRQWNTDIGDAGIASAST